MFDVEGVATEVLANFITTGCRAVFNLAHPCARNLGAMLRRRAKADALDSADKFCALPYRGKTAAVILFTACAIPVGWYAGAGDVTPYSVQIWGGTVMLGIFAYGLFGLFRTFPRYLTLR